MVRVLSNVASLSEYRFSDAPHFVEEEPGKAAGCFLLRCAIFHLNHFDNEHPSFILSGLALANLITRNNYARRTNDTGLVQSLSSLVIFSSFDHRGAIVILAEVVFRCVRAWLEEGLAVGPSVGSLLVC